MKIKAKEILLLLGLLSLSMFMVACVPSGMILDFTCYY